MHIAPFGILKTSHQDDRDGLYNPMEDWPASEDYKKLMDGWLAEISDKIWPAWINGGWVGNASTDMIKNTKDEIEIAVGLYHGGSGQPDKLKEKPDIPPPQDGIPRNHEWHYRAEDADNYHHNFTKSKLFNVPDKLNEIYEHTYEYKVSKNGWANHQLYDPTFDPVRFENLFFAGFRKHAPSLYDIKDYFQRPRPWTTSLALDIQGFRWKTAGGFTHTGLHPSLFSGHCIQGILGGCTVLEELIDSGGTIDPARLRAIQKYMVDWGDRRVFAGVHYMTDNIASWTLARRIIPHLFKNPAEVEKLAVEAIIGHSQVFADIVKHFDASNSARAMLLKYFPEASALS